MNQDKNSAWEGSLEAVAEGDSSDAPRNEQDVEAERPSGKAKVCSVCGKDVSHEQRFKDKKGHYWCTDCNRLDEARKHPAKCPDCQKEMTEADLVDYQGGKICKECAEKRTLADKRAAARIAAAEEEARLQKERKRLTLIVIGCLIGAGAVYGLIMLLINMLQPKLP